MYLAFALNKRINSFKDGDGALSSSEQQVTDMLQLTWGHMSLQDMHSVCPSYPWDEQLVSITVETNKKGWVTLNGFLAFWMWVVYMWTCFHSNAPIHFSLQTSHDYLHTLEYLAMMGYSSLVNSVLTTAIEGE